MSTHTSSLPSPSSASKKARRRSGRVPKEVERLGEAARKDGGRSKYASDGSDDEDVDHSPDEDGSAPESASDAEEVTRAKKGKSKKVGGDKGKGKATAGKPGKSGAKPRAARKSNFITEREEEEDEAAGGKTKGDVVISDDNDLYNAVSNPNTALEGTVDDWIESYKTDAGPAMAELVNFVLRASGCNSTIDEHQAEDENGVVDVLEDIDAEFKTAKLLAYPLISKSKSFKKFRSSLDSFLSRLFTASAATQILYDTSFCQLLQSWLTSLSSSTIRSFRHTATVISLGAVTALCHVAVAVNKEFESASRAREAEGKKGRKDKARLKDLGKNVEEVLGRKNRLEEFLTELFEAVFVHRYRDSEPLIRAECIKALGGWMKVYPDYWLEGNYLRYIGWVLSDDHKDVRHESVKSLLSLYTKEDHIGSMQHFTERFKAQLTRMATSEIDLPVRISCILVLQSINRHGLLDEEQRDQVVKLVFEEEKRVRMAVAKLFGGVLEENVQERITELEAEEEEGSTRGKKETAERKTRLEFKTLAQLLVKLGKETDGDDGEGDVEMEEEEEEGIRRAKIVRTHRGRIALAVEALWDQVDVVQGWKEMMVFLLLDHSSKVGEDEEATLNGKRGKGRSKKSLGGKKEELEVACRLEEEEETLLVEVLVASIARAMVSVGSTTKKEREKDEEQTAEITREVMDKLPRLFAKYQTDPTRIVDVLALPAMIKLDLYLDMQMVPAYESLWDDVTNQLLKHTEGDVIDQAIRCISVFLSTSSLANSNSTKIAALEEHLISTLREAVDERDVATSAFDDDELASIGNSVMRIAKLFTIRDISACVDDTEGEKRTSAFDILDALAERGRLGYKEEGNMVEQALTILYIHLLWRIRKVAQEADDLPEESVLYSIVAQRKALLAKLEDLCVGTMSNAIEGVKQVALMHLLDTYLLSAAATSSTKDPNGALESLRLVCSDQVQARCAGFVEAEIERYAEIVAEAREEEEEETAAEEEEEEEDSSEEEGEKKKKGKKGKGKGKVVKKAKAIKKRAAVTSATVRRAKDLARLLTSQHFEDTIAPFVRAIHSEVIDIRHATVILSRCDQFGTVFEQWGKMLAQDLKDEGVHGNQGESVAKIIFESFKEACDYFLTAKGATEEGLMIVTRVLGTATLVRGPQLSIVKKLPREDHARIHTDSIAYIVERLTRYVDSEQEDQAANAIRLFKPLAHLLTGLDGKGALIINSALTKSLESISVQTGAKKWQPLVAYQKRIATLVTKDPSVKLPAKVRPVQSEAELEEETTTGQKKRPKAKRITAETAPRKSVFDEVDDNEEEDEERPARRPATKRASEVVVTPRSESVKKRLVVEPAIESEEEQDELEQGRVTATPELDDDAEEVESLLLPSSQPRSSASKRPFTNFEEEEIEEDEEPAVEPSDEIVEDEEEGDGAAASRPPDSQTSTMSISDYKRKNKKARR